MPQELVRKGSKAATVAISLKGGVKHDKTSLNTLYTHEHYAGYILTCTLSLWLLVMFSGDAYRTALFSKQDQKIGMIRPATAAGDKEVLVILCSMKSAISHFLRHNIYLSTRE